MLAPLLQGYIQHRLRFPILSTVTIKAVATADSTKSAPAQATIRAILTPTVVWNETNFSQPGGDDGEASETPPGIAVVDDGAGGAYVLWEHHFPIEILAQHLDPNGQPMWAARWRSGDKPVDRLSSVSTRRQRRRRRSDRRVARWTRWVLRVPHSWPIAISMANA